MYSNINCNSSSQSCLTLPNVLQSIQMTPSPTLHPPPQLSPADIDTGACTVYTRVQVEFFGRENRLKNSTSTYIQENMRHTYRITKKCQNSLQQAKLRS